MLKKGSGVKLGIFALSRFFSFFFLTDVISYGHLCCVRPFLGLMYEEGMLY